jgi:hypothetical protein
VNIEAWEDETMTRFLKKGVAAGAALALFALLLSVQGCSSREGETETSGPATQKDSSQVISLKHLERVSTGSMDADGVIVDIQPLEFKDGKMKVKLRANTHIGNLADYNLVELTTLHYDSREVKPHAAGKLSGHHSSSIVEFETGSIPEVFSIKIMGIRNVEERVFSWAAGAERGGEGQ